MSEILNGYAITASARVDGATRVIMGESVRNGVAIYVVSTAPAHGTHWHNGRYFDGPDAVTNRNGARDAFARILLAEWSVTL